MSGMPTRIAPPALPANAAAPVNEVISKLEEEDANVSGDEGAEEEEEEEAKEE
jgi:hypothetical protein